MKSYAIIFSFLIILMFTLSSLAHADLVTSTFDSTESGPMIINRFVNPYFPSLCPGVNMGDPVQLTLSYDNSQPGSESYSGLLRHFVYQFTAAPSSISYSIDGNVFSNSYNQGNFTISVYNDTDPSVWGYEDDVLFMGREADGSYFSANFSGAGRQDILNNDSLPTLEQLSEFTCISGAVSYQGQSIQFTTPQPPWPPGPAPGVPLPGTVWLFGSGLLGLVGWRRFRKG